MTTLYHHSIRELRESKLEAIIPLIHFLSIDTSVFAPIGPPPARLDAVGIMAYNDAKMYCSLTSELYHKATLALAGISDAQGQIAQGCFQSVNHAIGHVANMLEGKPDAGLWRAATIGYAAASPLLAAKSVLPERGRNPFTSVFDAMQFAYIQADFLYYLVLLNDGGTLLNSPYVSPSQKENPYMPEVCEVILDEYYSKLSNMLKRCA